MGDLFSLADPRGRVIYIRGHRLNRPTFRIRGPQGTMAIYYCPCGQIAIERGDRVVGLANDGSESELAPCPRHGQRQGNA